MEPISTRTAAYIIKLQSIFVSLSKCLRLSILNLLFPVSYMPCENRLTTPSSGAYICLTHEKVKDIYHELYVEDSVTMVLHLSMP
jgi:hypothetical protein